ncbi:MAG: hypothetical protein NC253_15150 [Ruminococcus sp.]|nr:hypothetical protein [Ruminococcus sp.]MCM1382722.1 hypothetical protein [Muribaculaceae bacterium]MCM1480851.1 hypothetical protein [Muribaculaceae bacterium]
MNVEELKKHIHRELLGDRFHVKPVAEWQEHQKQSIMICAVKIMLRHNQSEKDIIQMLEGKFFLTEKQARDFVRKNAFSQDVNE